MQLHDSSPKGKSRKGNALIEFSLLGIPIIFITISIVEASLAMWQYHCLAYASEMTASYAAVHGATCAQNGNTCTIKISDMATFFAKQAIALDSGSVIVKFTDGSGTTTCSPLSSCNSNSTQFPNSSYNSVGSDITVKATYVVKNPIAMFWPPDQDRASDFTLGATSRQPILF